MTKKVKRKKTGKTSNVKFLLLVFVVAVVIFIVTPLENPLNESTITDEDFLERLCLPADSENSIYHPHYWLKYNEDHEQASWVATVLDASHIISKTVERSDSFKEDPLVVTGSALSQDYSKSGFDRGHLLSFASNGWSDETGNASFYMSNMSPQYPNTNRHTYERIEEAERSSTVQNGKLLVVHGPVLSDGPYKIIGSKNRISVPNRYFVCFLDYTGNTNKAIGFIIPNDNKIYDDISEFAVPVNKIEEITGIDFWPLLPDSNEEDLENMCNVQDWDLSRFSREKLAQKYGYDLSNMKEDNTGYEKPSDIKTYILYFLYSNFAPFKKQIIEESEKILYKTSDKF